MKKILGIEFGSTRIKSVLVDENAKVLVQGSYEWENKLVNGIWTYGVEEIWIGLKASYADLLKNYGKTIEKLDGIGISAMMHGYLAFDENDNLLAPFHTWRNTYSAAAADILTEKFGFNVPIRWSVSQYYQDILNGESYVGNVKFLTTLAGYVHWKLTGKKVLGIDDASGMFPISGVDYDKAMLDKFNVLLRDKEINYDFYSVLPSVLVAGADAGFLTESGAKLLDETGSLKAGAIMCPPEGDAGTGMVATNSVKPRTGNVSAGTSAFVMAVMKKPLENVYREIDVVTTPSGSPVAMVHVNNFTSEINAWTGVFEEVVKLCGGSISKGELFDRLFKKSAESDSSTGGLVGYNFLSGEPIVGVSAGRPLFARLPDSKLNLANFMQMQIYSALGALHLGMKILEKESVEIDAVCGHGGFFNTEPIGANAMSVALNAPITIMEAAGEGGAYGIALLALYAVEKKGSLEDFLDKIFASSTKKTFVANDAEKEKFTSFMKLYESGLALAQKAGEEL